VHSDCAQLLSDPNIVLNVTCIHSATLALLTSRPMFCCLLSSCRLHNMTMLVCKSATATAQHLHMRSADVADCLIDWSHLCQPLLSLQPGRYQVRFRRPYTRLIFITQGCAVNVADHLMQSVVCRFQTRPTMHSDHEDATADVTVPWPDSQLSEETQRRLLLSQNSVTARFEAQKLWDQGYNGAKVKVGVFDTGIRADHPHVKNIR